MPPVNASAGLCNSWGQGPRLSGSPLYRRVWNGGATQQIFGALVPFHEEVDITEWAGPPVPLELPLHTAPHHLPSCPPLLLTGQQTGSLALGLSLPCKASSECMSSEEEGRPELS